jgi:hypothetical protein
MDFVTHSFRMADRLLQESDAYADIARALQSLSLLAIVERHLLIGARRAPPAGAQTAINELLDDPGSALRGPGWNRQVRLFPRPARAQGRHIEADPLRAWTMDFKRDNVGVEVSFNHAEATAWQFTKLSIAGESHEVDPAARIDVGVVITAHSSLKSWGRMDGAVLTFDVCRSWLAQMKRVVPTPILLIGLSSNDPTPNPMFRGTVRRIPEPAPGEADVPDELP